MEKGLDDFLGIGDLEKLRELIERLSSRYSRAELEATISDILDDVFSKEERFAKDVASRMLKLGLSKNERKSLVLAHILSLMLDGFRKDDLIRVSDYDEGIEKSLELLKERKLLLERGDILIPVKSEDLERLASYCLEECARAISQKIRNLGLGFQESLLLLSIAILSRARGRISSRLLRRSPYLSKIVNIHRALQKLSRAGFVSIEEGGEILINEGVESQLIELLSSILDEVI